MFSDSLVSGTRLSERPDGHGRGNPSTSASIKKKTRNKILFNKGNY